MERGLGVSLRRCSVASGSFNIRQPDIATMIPPATRSTGMEMPKKLSTYAPTYSDAATIEKE